VQKLASTLILTMAMTLALLVRVESRKRVSQQDQCRISKPCSA